MLVHKETTKRFRKDYGELTDKDKRLMKMLTYPFVDHEIYYSQRTKGSRGNPTVDNIFVVSYSYYNDDKSEHFKEWKNEVDNENLQFYFEPCLYGLKKDADLQDMFMIIVAGTDINMDEAVKFVHNKPHPYKYIEFDN